MNTNDYFLNILNECNKINITNSYSEIDVLCKLVYTYMNKVCENQELYDCFKNMHNICTKTTSGNFSHNIATIRGICIRNIEFIKEK